MGMKCLESIGMWSFLWSVFSSIRTEHGDLQSDTVSKVSLFGVFLVCIFPHLNWIRRLAEKISVFSANAGKYGPEKLRIRTLVTPCGYFIQFEYGKIQTRQALRIWWIFFGHCKYIAKREEKLWNEEFMKEKFLKRKC